MAKGSNNRETLILVLSVLISTGLLGVGLWFFRDSLPQRLEQMTQPSSQNSSLQQSSAQTFDTISYSTVSQIENQKTVRVVPVNGISPTDRTAIENGTYPICRKLQT